MNGKKGFTLVELMAILVILGVILLMAMPSITKTFKDSQTQEAGEYKKTLCIAAQSYMELEKVKYENGKKVIKIDDLKAKGYIRENIKIPESTQDNACVQIQENRTCSLVSCS